MPSLRRRAKEIQQNRAGDSGLHHAQEGFQQLRHLKVSVDHLHQQRQQDQRAQDQLAERNAHEEQLLRKAMRQEAEIAAKLEEQYHRGPAHELLQGQMSQTDIGRRLLRVVQSGATAEAMDRMSRYQHPMNPHASRDVVKVSAWVAARGFVTHHGTGRQIPVVRRASTFDVHVTFTRTGVEGRSTHPVNYEEETSAEMRIRPRSLVDVKISVKPKRGLKVVPAESHRYQRRTSLTGGAV